MNNTLYQEAAQNAAKAKFHGRKTLNCRTVPMFPASAEREFKRLTNAYVKILNAELKEELPDLVNDYKMERRNDSRFDDFGNFQQESRRVFNKIFEKLEKKLSGFQLEKRLTKISNMTKENALREWKRAVHDTLGIDLLSDYYSGSFYERYLTRWIQENIAKIKSIPEASLGKMQNIIIEGYRNGKSVTEIRKEIQHQYGSTKRDAQLLARDQIASLNADITEAQQRDAGVTKYRWSSSHDSRVRDCHREFDGKVFLWNDPPEIWYDTKSRGRVYTGRRCHPGQDIQCRCVAIPVFDFDTLDVPIDGNNE